MIFSTIEQFAELFALNEKAGIAPATLFDVLSNSFCSAPVHVNYGKMILEGKFSPPGGAMKLGAKDNELILKAGEAFGTPLPMASLLRDRFITSFARGEGELDFCALSNRAREDAGLKPKA
jgi:3-hydroxyisobutyrate dehydrogenase-like beta-hydroxyacid dehydrogenase